MGKTEEFFSTYLPNKLTSNPEMVKSTKGIFVFKIATVGEWTLNMDVPSVEAGAHASPGCVISTDKATWETILDNPGKAVSMVMMGKMKVSNLGMATALQKILA